MILACWSNKIRLLQRLPHRSADFLHLRLSRYICSCNKHDIKTRFYFGVEKPDRFSQQTLSPVSMNGVSDSSRGSHAVSICLKLICGDDRDHVPTTPTPPVCAYSLEINRTRKTQLTGDHRFPNQKMWSKVLQAVLLYKENPPYPGGFPQRLSDQRCHFFWVGLYSVLTERLCRPLRLRLASTRRPPLVLIRFINPCSRFLGIRFG